MVVEPKGSVLGVVSIIFGASVGGAVAEKK